MIIRKMYCTCNYVYLKIPLIITLTNNIKKRQLRKPFDKLDPKSNCYYKKKNNFDSIKCYLVKFQDGKGNG